MFKFFRRDVCLRSKTKSTNLRSKFHLHTSIKIAHLIEHMSFFPRHMLVQNSQDLLPRFNEIAFDQLGDLKTPKPSRYFVRVILLYSSQGNQKIRVWQRNKKNG